MTLAAKAFGWKTRQEKTDCQGKKEGVGGGLRVGNTQGGKVESRKWGLMQQKGGDPQGSQACQPEGKEVGEIPAGGAHGRRALRLCPGMPDGSLAPMEKITFHVAFHLSLILLTFPSGVEWMVLIQLLICFVVVV